MSFLNGNNHFDNENYHWTKRAAVFVKDSGKWLRNGISEQKLTYVQMTNSNTSLSASNSKLYSTKPTLTKNDQVNCDDYEAEDFCQPNSQPNLNYNSVYHSSNEITLCHLSNDGEHTLKNMRKISEMTERECRKYNSETNHFSLPIKLMPSSRAETTSDNCISYNSTRNDNQQPQQQQQQRSFSPPIRQSSVLHRNHLQEQHKCNSSSFIGELTSETNLLTSLTLQQQIQPLYRKISGTEERTMAQSLNCPLRSKEQPEGCLFLGLSSSSTVSQGSPNSPTSATHCGNYLMPQKPLRRCRSASPGTIRPPLLSPEHQQLIRKSWQRVSKSVIGKSIYDKMIEKCKDVSNFFEEDYNGIVRHQRYFVDLIQSAVDNLTDMDAGMKPWLETIGKGHNGFSIRSRHWDAFGEALVCAVTNWVGPGKTRRETVRAWRQLFSFISDRLGSSSRFSTNFNTNQFLTSSSIITACSTPRIQLLNLVSSGPNTPP